MLKRKKELKRGGRLERRSRLSPISARRKSRQSEYARARAEYLALHPFCQIYMLWYELSEIEVICAHGRVRNHVVPRSDQIHHRNKRREDRLLDQRWWMAASRECHEHVETHLHAARALGIVLPFNADADGKTPAGVTYSPTPELMATFVVCWSAKTADA